jgi:putative endonuclease
MVSRAELGAQGEHLAAELLRSKGYHILGTNLRTRFSEVDILCQNHDSVVIVEVKTRTSTWDDPLNAIGPRKLQRLRRALHSAAARFPDRNIRLDAVTVYWKPDYEPIITHHENLL